MADMSSGAEIRQDVYGKLRSDTGYGDDDLKDLRSSRDENP